jgi:hypothetical protein
VVHRGSRGWCAGLWDGPLSPAPSPPALPLTHGPQVTDVESPCVYTGELLRSGWPWAEKARVAEGARVLHDYARIPPTGPTLPLYVCVICMNVRRCCKPGNGTVGAQLYHIPNPVPLLRPVPT